MNIIVSDEDIRICNGHLCRRMELSDTYTEGDYSLTSYLEVVPVKNCIGRKVHKAELGNAWTPREHTAESLKLARERESNRRLLQK